MLIDRFNSENVLHSHNSIARVRAFGFGAERAKFTSVVRGWGPWSCRGMSSRGLQVNKGTCPDVLERMVWTERDPMGEDHTLI